MAKKRILITEVSGECRNLRIDIDPFDDDPGYYCMAYPHGAGEKIDPKQCETCTREKHLIGETPDGVKNTIAKVLCEQDSDEGACRDCACQGNKNACDLLLSGEGYIARAEAVLNALLGKKENE